MHVRIHVRVRVRLCVRMRLCVCVCVFACVSLCVLSVCLSLVCVCLCVWEGVVVVMVVGGWVGVVFVVPSAVSLNSFIGKANDWRARERVVLDLFSNLEWVRTKGFIR